MPACGHTPIWSGQRVLRTNARGRHTYLPEFKHWIVEQALQPGMSLAGLAMGNQVNANQLRRWVQLDGRHGEVLAAPARLLPVTIAAAPTAVTSSAVAEVAVEIDPLVGAVRRYVMASDKIHGDDTPVKVLAPGTGKTRTGRLWVYVRDDRPAGDSSPRAAWFTYSPDRGGEHPQEHLRGFRGALQADAYAGWPRLYATGRVQEVACWAHARRPWWDLFLISRRDPDSLAAQALGRIRALYEIEEEIRGQPPDVRRAQRQARAGPLLEAMRTWLEELLPRVSVKSDIAQAIGYSLTRWTALTRYVDDGRLEIDNNAAERALRGVALGRGNYLFMGSDAGGERAAALYSLVETAKLNGLDPEAYLREVLGRIAEHPVNRVDELLPWNIAEQPLKKAA